MTARGLRNFNPGNIRKSSTVWQGMADSQPDPDFVTFKSAAFGIRAMAKNLLTYQNHDGCKTLRQIIGRYAPPNENNTPAYLAAVVAGIPGYGADDPINVDSAEVMTPLIKAIILHEDAVQPYPDSVIAEGIRLAGVADAPPPKLASQHVFQAQVGTGVSLAGAAVVSAVKGAVQDPANTAHQIKGVADSLGDYSSVPLFGHIITTLLTVAGGLALVGIAAQFMKQRTA